jgi:hypothetical protein
VQKTGPDEPSVNSLREDIPKEHLPRQLQRQKGAKYVRLWGPDVWDRTPIRELVTELTK